ncbi:MAG: hypothetical protein R2747_22720 [Pyrinomonadaceae bacterium]
MKFHVRLLILAFFLTSAGFYLTVGRSLDLPTPKESFLFPLAPREIKTDNAEITIKVLKEHCGQCHQSSLPTANPKALAIFDLDKTPWYGSVSDQRLESISRRIGKKSGISDSDRSATLEFIDCIRRGDCRE